MRPSRSSLATLVLAAAPWGSKAAFLLRGQPTNRQLETVLDLPGVSVNVNDNGDVVVETPWASVVTGDNGTHVHGPTPQTLGSLTCETLGPWDTDAEPTCTTALPAFFEATATFGQDDKPKDRKKVMDDFCGVPCGEVWTSGVVAENLNCPTPDSDQEQEQEQDQDDNDSNDTVDVSDDGVVVDVPGAAVSTTPGGGVNVQAPGTSVTRNPSTGQVQVEAPGSVSVNTANGPVAADSTTTTKTKPAKTLQNDNNNDNNINNKATSSSSSSSSSKKGQPTYPADYPGLRMGCIKDKKDNEYCAVKRASVTVAAASTSTKKKAADAADAAANAPACDFYLSCCYAQYAAMFGEIPEPFMEEVESACPGSKAFLEGDLCTE